GQTVVDWATDETTISLKQAVIINAPLEAVWAFSMDITKIPEFYPPRVVKVELLSGKALREPGVSYQRCLSGGANTGGEKGIEILHMQKICHCTAGGYVRNKQDFA